MKSNKSENQKINKIYHRINKIINQEIKYKKQHKSINPKIQEIIQNIKLEFNKNMKIKK